MKKIALAFAVMLCFVYSNCDGSEIVSWQKEVTYQKVTDVEKILAVWKRPGDSLLCITLQKKSSDSKSSELVKYELEGDQVKIFHDVTSEGLSWVLLGIETTHQLIEDSAGPVYLFFHNIFFSEPRPAIKVVERTYWGSRVKSIELHVHSANSIEWMSFPTQKVCREKYVRHHGMRRLKTVCEDE